MDPFRQIDPICPPPMSATASRSDRTAATR